QACISLARPHCNRFTIDVLHGEPGNAVLRSAIKEARDIGMFEARQNLSFFAEPLAQTIQIAPVGGKLQSYSLVVFRIVAPCFKHQSHAAPPDFATDSIRTKMPSFPKRQSARAASHALYSARNPSFRA